MEKKKGYKVSIDVDKVAKGENDLPYKIIEGYPLDAHFTIIEITQHNRPFKGRTIAKIQEYLSSMYREDFRRKTLELVWNGVDLAWVELFDRILRDKEGQPYIKEFHFEIPDSKRPRHVFGWVGVLEKGSRKDAGFSILHANRVVMGSPDPWRPPKLYGQEQGSNDLVNQRLVGEIHLDDFEISHTKDGILWLGDQEELVRRRTF